MPLCLAKMALRSTRVWKKYIQLGNFLKRLVRRQKEGFRLVNLICPKHCFVAKRKEIGSGNL